MSGEDSFSKWGDGSLDYFGDHAAYVVVIVVVVIVVVIVIVVLVVEKVGCRNLNLGF
jgi:heme exporter protein D